MRRVRARPVAIGALIGAIIGAGIGVIVSTQSQSETAPRLDSKSAAGIGVALVSLVQRLVEAFG